MRPIVDQQKIRRKTLRKFNQNKSVDKDLGYDWNKQQTKRLTNVQLSLA